MKATDFIVIQAPMVTDLKLSGNRLIIYAIIHGYCKDGEHEFNGSINYICEWTNLTRNTVISTLKSLADDGLVNKREYTANGVKFCAYSLGSAKIAPVVQNTLNFSQGGSAKIAPNNIEINNINKDNISLVAETDDEFVDRIYKTYPSSCPVRQARLGKSESDKRKIKTLLKRYNRKDIEKVVKAEIEDKLGKHPLKNFSTFLNNFPDPNDLFSAQAVRYPQSVDDVKDEDNMPTFEYWNYWVESKCKNIWENLKGLPRSHHAYQCLADHTIGGTKALCYVTLVLNRDGWEKYDDPKGFMFVYSNYIKANGLFKE